MSMIKVYSRNKFVLDKVCSDYNIKPNYIYNHSEIFGKGYCYNGEGMLVVFTDGSHVDVSDDFKDITENYQERIFML